MSAAAQTEAPAFAGRQVWVTGAARGIGSAIARQFVRAGARVTALDCQFPDDYCAAANGVPVLLDIAHSAQVATVVASLLAAGSGPQVLVNAAGILRLGALETLADADWQACLDVNVSGVFYLLRALIPHFRAQRGGSIVSVASNAAHVPRLQMGAYCASKAALASLSHCAGLELAPWGVRCNLVSPGSTATPMLASMLGDPAALAQTIAGLPEQFRLGIPLQKIATPADIAAAVVFLASDQAGHITLQDLVIDGGATLGA